VQILEVINKTTPFFEKHGVESPRLTIELLLAHLLKKRRLDLYLEFERELGDATLEKLREMVKRRAAGEPLQYITGVAHFHGLGFAVDRRVLIPRPETELLVETVIGRLKSEEGRVKSEKVAGVSPAPPDGAPGGRALPGTNRQSPITLVDLGTGSGCIAVTLAKKLASAGGDAAATIYATDTSAGALEVAQGNARRHGVEKSIRFLEGDLLSILPDSLRADAIVSNPPYIANGELAKLPKEVRDFEPVGALVAGETGLEVYRRLAAEARRYLSPTGFVALELGAGQRAAVAELFENSDYRIAEVEKDLQGHERVIVVVPE
jgi:release factor glutamine methyltransferase